MKRAPAARCRTLSVSIVTFDPDLPGLGACLDHLDAAIQQLPGVEVALFVVDNGPVSASAELAKWLGRRLQGGPPGALRCHHVVGHGNVGYGRGHNLALARSRSDVHLILNPDAEVAEDALAHGVRWLEQDPAIALVAAWTVGPDGSPQRLCKTYPSVLVLALRALGWNVLTGRQRAYDVEPDAGVLTDVTGKMVSGSFMLCSTAKLKAVGGFDPAFFLYFEDFDLSIRLAAQGRLVWSRDVGVLHHGGSAAAKGWRHRLWFVRSAFIFFNRHGWKLW